MCENSFAKQNEIDWKVKLFLTTHNSSVCVVNGEVYRDWVTTYFGFVVCVWLDSDVLHIALPCGCLFDKKKIICSKADNKWQQCAEAVADDHSLETYFSFRIGFCEPSRSCFRIQKHFGNFTANTNRFVVFFFLLLKCNGFRHRFGWQNRNRRSKRTREEDLISIPMPKEMALLSNLVLVLFAYEKYKKSINSNSVVSIAGVNLWKCSQRPQQAIINAVSNLENLMKCIWICQNRFALVGPSIEVIIIASGCGQKCWNFRGTRYLISVEWFKWDMTSWVKCRVYL